MALGTTLPAAVTAGDGLHTKIEALIKDVATQADSIAITDLQISGETNDHTIKMIVSFKSSGVSDAFADQFKALQDAVRGVR